MRCGVESSSVEQDVVGYPMDSNYILQRLRSDSRHVAELAALESQIGHAGVKGRFRELVLNNLLLPWLPSAVASGTGLVVDHHQAVAVAGQDDIVLFDPFLAPSILASSQSTDGVYLFDSVLCRIEVKSKLTKGDLAFFTESSAKIARLELVVAPGRETTVFGALNMIMAFTTEVARGKELEYLCSALKGAGLEPCSGIVSAMCIADRGFWLLGMHAGRRVWKSLQVSDPGDPLAYFVGVVSNSCFEQRAARQGTLPLGGGIGNYIGHPFEVVTT